MPISLFAETFEGLGIATDIGMPAPAIPIAPIPTVLSAPVSAIPIVLVFAAPITLILAGPGKFPFPFIFSFIFFEFVLSRSWLLISPRAFLIGPLPTAPSQFEVGSSSTTIPDPASEAAIFFAHFDQPEVNDLSPVDFWAFGPTYVDFHGFRVPEDCVSHLVMVYGSHGDFMQGFRLGRSSRKHFLKMLGSVMNDIEHSFVDTVSTERILQWRATI